MSLSAAGRAAFHKARAERWDRLSIGATLGSFGLLFVDSISEFSVRLIAAVGGLVLGQILDAMAVYHWRRHGVYVGDE